MGVWYVLSVCGIFLSIWGVAQLIMPETPFVVAVALKSSLRLQGIMGNAYANETVMLVDDVEPLNSQYNSFDDFLILCEKHYRITARNCFVAAYVYVWVLAASVVSMLAARFVGLWLSRKHLERDEYYCEIAPKLKKLEKKTKTHTN